MSLSGPEKLARKLAISPCETCGQVLTVWARLTCCGCALGEMYCPRCKKNVGRTGIVSGEPVYGHEGCGTVSEDRLVDPRILPFLTAEEVESGRAREV